MSGCSAARLARSVRDAEVVGSNPTTPTSLFLTKQVNSMQSKKVIKKLKSLSDPEAVAGMARFGINPENTLGVSIPNLRKMAKDCLLYTSDAADDLLCVDLGG